MTQPETDRTILEMTGIHKAFGGIPALRDVHFQLEAREIHGLLGGNGAGKTTLMNILYGLYREDAGQIVLHGKPVTIHSPHDAIANRIGMVHQHFLQVNNFSVLENIVLGTQGKGSFSADTSGEAKKISELAQRFALEVNLNAEIGELPMGSRQKVEILKALYRGVEILILDEPTTNLTPQEVDDLFVSLREMVNQGLSIVFITHKLREVLSVCDRISVLRNGENVLTLRRSEASEEAFVRAMVGDEMDIEQSVIFAEKGVEEVQAVDGRPAALELQGVSVVSAQKIPLLTDINLDIKSGEILGIAGVAGNGQQELAEVVMQVLHPTTGQVCIAGQDVTGKATDDLFEMRMAYIPEDRLHDGFLPRASVAHNLILGWHKNEPYSKGGFIDWRTVYSRSSDMIRRFNIKASGPGAEGANLSGGNIQRVMLARALAHAGSLLVAHNPTRGLDIPSMDFFYNQVLERKAQGMGILLLSENLDELLLLCDRIAVLYRGEVMGVLPRSGFEKYEIGRMMSGVRNVA